MWRKLSGKGQEKYLAKWIKKISTDGKESPSKIKLHIIRHAKHVAIKDPKIWTASMRNLVEILEAIYKIKPSVRTRLERLEKKYNKNHRRYTSPPKL